MCMQTKEWTFRHEPQYEERYSDVSQWPAGPWDGEPDKIQWEDPETKLACLAVRNRMGAWCGYVGLPTGHAWREMGYDDIPAEVHGGLTYGPRPCMEDHETGICHTVEDGDDDDVRWIGFDCNHAMDQAPGMIASYRHIEERMGISYEDSQAERGDIWREVYRDVAYVRSEVAYLASQVAAAHAAR